MVVLLSLNDLRGFSVAQSLPYHMQHCALGSQSAYLIFNATAAPTSIPLLIVRKVLVVNPTRIIHHGFQLSHELRRLGIAAYH